MELVLKTGRKDLRSFGFLMAGVIPTLFGLFFPWVFNKPIPNWPFILSVAFLLPALIYPPALKIVYITWMRFGFVLGKINSKIILTLMFYLVITPVAFLMKLMKNDPMARQLKSNENSYRILRKESLTKKNMETPF